MGALTAERSGLKPISARCENSSASIADVFQDHLRVDAFIREPYQIAMQCRIPRRERVRRARRLLSFALLVGLSSVRGDFKAASAEPPPRPWQDYRTIMWISDPVHGRPEKVPLFFQRLREMGINTAMVYGDGDTGFVLENHFPYYVENLINRGLCLKWNSNVRDWDAFVTRWAKTGRPEAALVRDYCLDDPRWQDWANQEMSRIVRKNRPHSPLAYDIRDELSTTLSANPFDYDFNPLTLSGFRAWLQTQYRDLAALNTEWNSRFDSWDAVRPFTTDQIKNRMASGEAQPQGNPDWQQLEQLKFDAVKAHSSPVRWNFAPWCDFRTYMDQSLANVLGGLRKVARESDPATPVGIEGTQMPNAFGGYDLWRLSGALDWVEAYDIGNAREIFGSFMPGKPILTTVFESDTRQARRRLWHLLLEGDRGCLVWWSEDCIAWQSDDYALTPKAKALAPVLREMTSPLAQLFLRATPERDPVFIHYSQPSIQVDWLLESTVDGSTWLRRFPSFEADHNRQVKVRDGWLKACQDLGYSPEFISSEQIEAGDLQKAGATGPLVLVLPCSWAISDREAVEIKRLLEPSQHPTPRHTLFCDGSPGQFDQHGKLRETSALGSFSPPPDATLPACFAIEGGKSARIGIDIAAYTADRLKLRPELGLQTWLASHLRGLEPEVSLPASACVRTYRFKSARGHLVAFERNISYQMSEELKQAGGNEALEQPVDLDAKLQHPMHVYDLRSQTYLGYTNQIHFSLDPWQPSLFALTPEPAPNGNK